MNTKILYIISAVIAVVLLIIGIIIYLKRKKLTNLKKHIQELERQRNLIVSTPIMSELSKIEVIIKNDKLESKYEDWVKRYEYIKNNRFSLITDKLLEIDALIDTKKVSDAKSSIKDLEMEIYKIRTSTDALLDEIREITMSEERNRAIVTKLKSKFRELERTLENNAAAYKDIYKYIGLQLENIEKHFSDFELIMENNEYTEVSATVKVLDEMINHIEVVIEEIPDLLLLTDKIIPERINEATENYNKLINKGFPLKFLNFDYNISEIEKKVSEISSKIKILNLEDSMFELKTFLDYLDGLFEIFDKERISKKIFDENAKEFKIKVLNVNKIVSEIYEQLDDIKNMYNLGSEDIEDLNLVNTKLFKNNSDYNEIINNLKNKTEPYSILKDQIIRLSSEFENTQEELNDCLKSLGNMQDDEMRAREQLTEITNLLNKCRMKIRTYPLPIISNNYFVELSEANDAAGEIIKELQKTPITIKTLNIRVDTARDLALKLYNTTNEMIKTSTLAEMSIIYGNRFKPIDVDIEKGIDIATQLFFKGNYKKSLETSIASIKIVEPDFYKKILNLYKKEN